MKLLRLYSMKANFIHTRKREFLNKIRIKIPNPEFLLISANEYGKMGTLIDGGVFYGDANRIFEPASQLEG